MWQVSEIADLGPFFRVQQHRARAVDDTGQPAAAYPPWQSMVELVSGVGLTRRVAAVRSALAASGDVDPDKIPVRVAVSVAHMGIVARLLAPFLASRALSLPPLDMTLSALWWQDELGGPFPLSVQLEQPGIQHTAGIPDCVVQITRSYLEQFRVSARVLWGNVGSAINSAATMIADRAPSRATAATSAANLLLTDDRIDRGNGVAGADFRRRSCCLIYQISPERTAICGDCVLGG